MTKIIKIVCLFLYYGFARYLPKSYMPFNLCSKYVRFILCRRIFKRIGTNVNVERLSYFGDGSGIEIGDNSGLGINCHITYAKIGKNVMIGPDVFYIKANHKFDRLDIPLSEQGSSEAKPLIIEDNAWIGARVILLPGITIGEGAVIGAGSVITSNVPSYAIAAGNPARVIKYRNLSKNINAFS
jgi:maltose O-acetyltransferase